jgi:hypothetical protein
VAATLCAAACSALLGLDDDFRAAAGGGGGAATTASSGGAPSGTTGSAGTAGTGQAGAAASGGGGTTGGTGGSGGAGTGGAASGGASGGMAGGGMGGGGGTGGNGGGGGGAPPCALKRVFVTGAQYTGDFALGAADAWAKALQICQTHAQAGGLGGSWQPWLSTESADAITKFADGGPWYLTDCTTLVANDKADIAPCTTVTCIAHGIDRNEHNQLVVDQVWTGTFKEGNKSSTCTGWTSLGGAGRRGRTNEVGQKWTEDGTATCAALARLYCFEL